MNTKLTSTLLNSCIWIHFSILLFMLSSWSINFLANELTLEHQLNSLSMSSNRLINFSANDPLSEAQFSSSFMSRFISRN